LSKLKTFYTNGKLSKCRFQKWACILHLKLQVSCYKLVVMIKRKIISQIASFDSQPLKPEKQGSFSLWGNCFMRNFVRAITHFTSHWEVAPQEFGWGYHSIHFLKREVVSKRKLIWRNWQGAIFLHLFCLWKKEKIEKKYQTLNFWVERVILTIAQFIFLWKYCVR